LRSCMLSKSSLTRPMFDQLCKPCFFEFMRWFASLIFGHVNNV
jgi:hypothetical protein